MKTITLNKLFNKLMLTITLSFGFFLSHAQDIHFTFENSQNTNDGTNDYFETDVMIQSINTSGSFKLGSGQLYFTYNTLAFGENVFANGKIETTQPNEDGYICGQYIDAAAASLYGTFVVNDNTTSRVSWAFSQAFSSSTIAIDNVTATPTKLFHLKMQYVDVVEEPMVMFEEDPLYLDQFFTACGVSTTNSFETANCTAEPGTQIYNDTFNSEGAVLSNDTNFDVSKINIYPNPVSKVLFISSPVPIDSMELFNILGEKVTQTFNSEYINVEGFKSGIYLLKVFNNNGSLTKKIVIE